MNTLSFFIKKYLFLKKKKEKIYIYCTIRKKFLLYKEEEVTRQYIIFLLKKIKKYHTSNILLEYPIYINKFFYKRLDILVKKNNKPHIIIECKSISTVITQKTFDQISLYNKFIKSPYLIISNGLKNFIFKKKKNRFDSIKFIP
ncbi:type I restriction enzyme HsdR N-terminal domain-containing protein [Blattabacterium cuenoti]|uniref:type I restriction enzyme HsdR N-terminal domain-containing protein n=1 Tax=Blattabacterium cuenoti TaxID=1653831 RepID=UPI00163CADB2|nr:type I restriction enzyme HsdR N-terminal domain-containing protein [Blattabacterium cuenoti]